MKKFVFKLQRVLDYKGIRENEEKAEYGKAFSEYENEKTTLNKLKNDILNIMNEKDKEEKMTIDKLKYYGDYLKFLEQKIEFQEQKVENARKYLEERRQKLVEISKEKKTFEKLKEKAKEDYNKETIREDDAFNDQINAYSSSKGEE
jgi:flagellar FliJ protein